MTTRFDAWFGSGCRMVFGARQVRWPRLAPLLLAGAAVWFFQAAPARGQRELILFPGVVTAREATNPDGLRGALFWCFGDCDSDGRVTVNELLTAVNIALDSANIDSCIRSDANVSGTVTVDELLTAVNHALNGCPAANIVDNGDGTVTDNRTGLLWEKKESLDGIANYSNPSDGDNTYTWSAGRTDPDPDGTAFTDFLDKMNNGCDGDASKHCASNADCAGIGHGLCGYAGYRDWRLPEVNRDGAKAELETILHEPYPCDTRPCLDPIFGPTQAYLYWSSTPLVSSTDHAWSVSFVDGYLHSSMSKITPLYVRAVLPTALATARHLFNQNSSPSYITKVLRDDFELPAYDAGVILKQLAYSDYTIQSMLMDAYDTYAVISNVQSSTSSVPPGYTGVASCDQKSANCTEPYIPGLLGHFVSPSDINAGIGGDYRFVFVKYDLVPRTSTQFVVTGVTAQPWPEWHVRCPAGWTPVSALTTHTEDSCWTNGMCAKYERFADADSFVTTAAVSYGKWGNPASLCPGVCGSTTNIWPMYTDALDIHTGCGDEIWVYFCYNKARAWPARPTTIEVSDDEKVTFLTQYAPRIVLYPEESYWPSSVDWAFEYLFRYSPNNFPSHLYSAPRYALFPAPDPKYYVIPKEPLGLGGIFSDPSSILEYFHGCDGRSTETPCQLGDATAYAFWNKQTITLGGEAVEVINLTYFFYYPYNRGKEYADTVWGNHVSDWEHMTVRLSWVYDSSAGWKIRPIHVFVSAHDFGTAHPWDTITTVAGSDHVIVYSAQGGHGNYVAAGPQRYAKIEAKGVTIATLYDYTAEGAQWDTWMNLGAFDFNAKKGLGVSSWPRWMSTEYHNACAPDNVGCDPYDPASGPIYRWGTKGFGDCELFWQDTGCRMSPGPTGPIEKGIWNDPDEP